jgi:hypothetical protein
LKYHLQIGAETAVFVELATHQVNTDYIFSFLNTLTLKNPVVNVIETTFIVFQKKVEARAFGVN